MAIQAGRHQFGPDQGRITLLTFRDGLAAQAGHDLTIEASRWSAELAIGADHHPVSLQARIDLGALTVREGTGGLKPLTDRDRREITVTAHKVLMADRFPEATFTATIFQPNEDGVSGVISGTLTLAGRNGPLELSVTSVGAARYRANGTIRQTAFGIKPYSGFLGALKVRDTVDFEVEVDLSAVADREAAA